MIWYCIHLSLIIIEWIVIIIIMIRMYQHIPIIIVVELPRFCFEIFSNTKICILVEIDKFYEDVKCGKHFTTQ